MKLSRLWTSTFGLVAIVAVVFTLATLTIGVLAYMVTHEALEEQLYHRVTVETEALLHEVRHEGMAELVEEIRRREDSRSTASLEYLLIDATGRRIAGTIDTRQVDFEGYIEFLHYRKGREGGVAQALGTRLTEGTLIVAADRGELAAIDRTLAVLFLGAMSGVLVAGIAGAALIGLATRRRLSRIEVTAKAIMAGEFGRRVAQDGSGSEFDRLAHVLNQMLERIEGLIQNLRQVSSDVAHDLRTPLTRLYTSLDRAMAEPEGRPREERLVLARAQAAELLEVFAAILRIAEIEGFADRLPRESIDFSQLVDSLVESYRPNMEDSGHILQSQIEPSLQVTGDRRLLSQALANLLDNCLRHTHSGTRVSVTARRHDDVVHLCVRDTGPGVEMPDPQQLFRRFARSDRARTTPGYGLGLSLVAAIAGAHGGSAFITSEGGFSVTVILPVQALPSATTV